MKLALDKPKAKAGQTPPSEAERLQVLEREAASANRKLQSLVERRKNWQRATQPVEEEEDASREQINDGEPVMNVGLARQWGPPWAQFHAALLTERAFTTLPRAAMQVLLYLMGEHARDYKNHGKLKVQLVDMQRVYGWSLRSADSLRQALATLLRRKLIRCTAERRGSSPAKYAITWLERKSANE